MDDYFVDDDDSEWINGFSVPLNRNNKATNLSDLVWIRTEIGYTPGKSCGACDHFY